MTKDYQEEELEEVIEPDKIFDCFDEGCEECTVCKYLNFREWAEGCAPSGSSIERNDLVEDYLKRKTTYGNARVEEIIKIAEEMKNTKSYSINDLEVNAPYALINEAYQTALTDLIEAIKK